MEPGSILGDPREVGQEPACLADLHLDQVVATVLAGREDYDLARWWYAPTRDVSTVCWRQEVFRDLEDPHVYEAVTGFAGGMRRARQLLAAAEQARFPYQQQRYVLEAAGRYREAVAGLRDGLATVELGSRGLRGFRDWLAGYTGSTRFRSLVADTEGLVAALGQVRYTVHARGGRVTVDRYRDQPDYRAEVAATFARFPYPAAEPAARTAPRELLGRPPSYASMNHLDGQILERVARLHPETFGRLLAFPARHAGFLDQAVAAFDRQVQFYLAWLEYLRRFRQVGLPVCYPRVSRSSKQTRVEQGWDVALAGTLVPERPVVVNDLRLAGPERIAVVTGPNQGGKTTFARMVGQLHYLAALGCPIPAARAELFLPDAVFTHFERAERLDTLRGKLDDELVRVRDILDAASGDSLVVMNESFTSTTLHDARLLGTRVLQRLIGLGVLGVYVTFVDELSTLDEATVSMVATVDPDDPARRTFRVVRRPADGRAYAAAPAAKHGLTYRQVRGRVGR
jgi:hypothetical protein